jgi:glycosyltransferase involved in cell wall biosynthesis
MELPNRILFICHDGDLYGSQQSLHLIVKYLPRDRYLCYISIARPGPLQGLLESYPNTVVLHHRRLQWVKHDPRTWLQKMGDVVNLLASAVPRTLYLYNTIRREKINVVHTNSTVSLEGALAAALAGVPHIWHIRELFMEPSPKFHPVLGRHLTRLIIDRFSDTVICISEAVHRQFGPCLEEDPDKYHVLHNALEVPLESGQLPALNDPHQAILKSLSAQALSLPETRGLFRLGYIGRLSEGKGFHELLEAFILLRRRNAKVDLVVAGNFVDEAYEHRIREAVSAEGLEKDIHFLGYRDDLLPVYEVMDLLVVPSRNEPFGRVVIEAMAQGVPCLGADSGGIPEIIDNGETGMLYPPGDVHTLIGLIEELMSAFWKLETIRQNARRMVCERFTIDRQIRTLDECYQSVIRYHQFQ